MPQPRAVASSSTASTSSAADAPAAVRLRDDERTELAGRAFVLDRRGDVQVGETDHLLVRFGDDDPVADDHEPLQT